MNGKMTLLKAITPILMLAEFFCLAPFGIEISKNRIYFTTYRKTFLYVVRMFALLAVLGYGVIYRQIKMSIVAGKGPFAATVYFTDYNWKIPGMILIYGLGNFYNRKIIAAMNDIVHLDADFKQLGYIVEYKYATFFTTSSLCIFAFKLLVQLSASIYGSFYDDFIKVIDFVVFILPSIQTHVMIMQWMSYMLLLKYHFRLLNKLLKFLKFRTCWMIGDFTGNCHKVSTLNLLKTSGQMYSRLCFVSRKVNETFAWQFLFMLPVLFIEIIIASYNICQVLKKKREFGLSEIVDDVVYFVALLEIILPCVIVKNEADKFVDLLHKLELSERDNMDVDVGLNVLILQTQHQKVQFSANGVFPLDGTLIYSILGALTTYLVILLQFDAAVE